MAKTIKCVSITTLDKIAKETFNNNIETFEWYGADIIIKHSIGLSDVLEFVNNVVESCFGESGNFIPEVMDFAIKGNILTKYANLTMPENLEHRYDLIYQTDIVDEVCKRINRAQLQEVISSIGKKIDYLCSVNASVVQQKLNELVIAFEGMQKQTASLFDNVSNEDIEKLIGAVSGGSISEEKIVEAYMKHKNDGADKK